MIRLALKSNTWVELSEWESGKTEWTPTVEVLNYHQIYAQSLFGTKTQIMLLCGGDLIETFLIPNLWKDDHVIKLYFSLKIFN